jgi:hypothetical protein
MRAGQLGVLGVTATTAAATSNFAFVGAGRSGSTWFYEVLREHPEVFVPPNKGTFFFSVNHAKGPAWYRSFFPEVIQRGSVGEVCEDYLSHPEALRRISAHRPDVRLICCLRNPYERALSAWRFFGRNGWSKLSLVARAADRPDIFTQGYYGTQLSALFSLFPAKHVLIFFFEEIAQHPADVARRLYEFIDVDPAFSPRCLFDRINANGAARVSLLARGVSRMHMHLRERSYLSASLVERLKRVRVLRQGIRTALYSPQIEAADWRASLPEFPEEVIDRYEHEISILEEMLKRDLSGWRARDVAVPRRAQACCR